MCIWGNQELTFPFTAAGRSQRFSVAVKMTFTLDEPTVAALKRIAARLQKPQSYVIREAICHYEPHAGRLSKTERKRRVDLFDRVVAEIPERPQSEVDWDWSKYEYRAVRMAEPVYARTMIIRPTLQR